MEDAATIMPGQLKAGAVAGVSSDVSVIIKRFELDQRQFENEQRRLSALARTPFFVTVYGVVSSGRCLVFADTAGSVYDVMHKLSTPLNRVLRLRILREVALAFAAFSSIPLWGIDVFADLSSSNVMLIPDWQTMAVQGHGHIVCVGSRRSPPVAHLMPTQLQRDHEHKQLDVDAVAADVYCFGVFAYEVWTGTFLHDEKDRSQVLRALTDSSFEAYQQLRDDAISPELASLIRSCCAETSLKDRSMEASLARPASFQAILQGVSIE